MKKVQAVDIVVFGVVQGVGFRPFIYQTARKLGYAGWVKNIGFGVEIHLEAKKPTDFYDFLESLEKDLPPLAKIEKTDISPADILECEEFLIQKSRDEQSFVFISPDISVCDNCTAEMVDPKDRRHRYPFINCTDCGPRYTIVHALPYDRDKTTMEDFLMCKDCQKEYTDPTDRRYHAQPIACPVCGPQVTLFESKSQAAISRPIQKAASLIKSGKILAVKGLGGFHLVCDALNPEAIKKLRKIKARNVKPLALMARDISTVEKYTHVGPEERELLSSPRRPIVLLRKKQDIPLIAPGLDELGFILPYTPLHHLLLEDIPLIVATSSNPKDAPIMKEESEGIDEFCDFALTHDRPIQTRADDSVMKVEAGQPLFIRRARGYVPYPQSIPQELESPSSILALGGELKDTVSVYKNGYVITSQFLGDLDEYQNLKYFEETIEHLTGLFEVKPELVVTDLHPDFHTTRYARRLELPHIKVQHHFAHVLAPLLEHNFSADKKVLGVALDGFGYGDDGTAWGGEFLVADYGGYERFAHFKTVPLPGGDLAAKQPWRMSVSYLQDVYGNEFPRVKALESVPPAKIKGLLEMIKQDINTPLTSSCGRLFDAVSFLLGLAPIQVEYEAEAPMLLESVLDRVEDAAYAFSWQKEDKNSNQPYILSFSKTVDSILQDLNLNIPVSRISAKFHNCLAEAVVTVAEKARSERSVDSVALGGGVFLNKHLLQRARSRLEEQGFHVLRPLNYSPNDESISIGQIAHALHHLKRTGPQD